MVGSIEHQANPQIPQANSRISERAILRQLLPADLQLTFAPTARRWNFGGELLRRRHSQVEEDRLFFQAVEFYHKRQPITPELNQQVNSTREQVAKELEINLTLQATKKALEEEKPNQALRIDIILGNLEPARQAIQEQTENGWLKSDDKIVQEMLLADPEFMEPILGKIQEKEKNDLLERLEGESKFEEARKAADLLVQTDPAAAKVRLQKALKRKHDQNTWIIAEALAPVDPQTVQQAMQRVGHWDSDRLIAILAPHDPEYARREMEKSIKDGWMRDAARIAVALAKVDPEAARKAMNVMLDEKHFSRYYDYAGHIALALGDYQTAERCMWQSFSRITYFSESVSGGGGYTAEYFAKALAEANPQAARTCMTRLSERDYYEAAGNIALALKDTESAEKCIQKLTRYGQHLDRQTEKGHGLNGGYEIYNAAGRLVFELLSINPKSAYKAMRLLLSATDRWFQGKDEMEMVLIPQDPVFAQSVQTRIAKAVQENRVNVNDAKVAAALASIYPQTAREVLSKMLADNAIDLALELAKRITVSPQTKRLFEVLRKQDDTSYSMAVTADLLRKKQDLGWFGVTFLPTYKAFQDLAIKTNSEMEEDKRWNNPKEFFDDEYVAIASLHLLNLRLGQGLLNNLVSRGLSFAQESLESYEPALTNPDVYEAIRQFAASPPANFSGMELGQLLETAAGYVSLGQTQAFIDILANPDTSWVNTATVLNTRCLELLANSLGCTANIQAQDISAWSISNLPHLLVSRQILTQKQDHQGLQLFDEVVKACLENRFSSFITSLAQEDKLGQEIAEHNHEVKKAFEAAGINWENWLNFSETGILTTGTTKVNREALFAQLERRLQDWEEIVTQDHPTLSASLKKDFARLQQQKKTFDLGKIDVSNPDWLKELFPTYSATLTYLVRKDPSFRISEAVTESFGHLQETITSLSRQSQEVQTRTKTFVVKKWDRDPRKDLFQGNATHCCIAMGATSLHPETLFQYLIDQGIQIVEIVDPETRKPVSQVWLFVSLDKAGRPIMIADNFEVNNRYSAGQNVNRAIRESMFQFLQKYTEAANIPRVILGNAGSNDVETIDLTSITVPPIEKLGGYFQDDEYYLEAANETSAYLIYQAADLEPEPIEVPKKATGRFHAIVSKLRHIF